MLKPETSVPVERTQWRANDGHHSLDQVAREEPLEIQIGGVALAVVMRTPGDDIALTWGFLITERVIETPDQIQSVRHCSRAPTPDAEDNVVQVVLAPDVSVDLARLRRNLYASSSCGICGKATIENAMATAPPIDDALVLSPNALYSLPQKLRSQQHTFDATGGLHAAGLFDKDGTPLLIREDVGRHNAVDKVVGQAVVDGLAPLGGHILVVSGRVSFEIVQKALAARIPLVAAVSAPTSLAIALAEESGITLVGFLRGERMCVYTHGHRISP